MAEVQIEEVIDHLSSEMKKALETAVNEVIPNASFDRTALYKAFKRAVYRKCSVWETVPDQFVKS